MLIFRQSYQSGKVDAGDSPQQPSRLKQHHEGYLFARTTLILTQDNTDIKNKNNKIEDCDFFMRTRTEALLYLSPYTISVIQLQYLPLLLDSPPSGKALNSSLHSRQIHTNLRKY